MVGKVRIHSSNANFEANDPTLDALKRQLKDELIRLSSNEFTSHKTLEKNRVLNEMHITIYARCIDRHRLRNRISHGLFPTNHGTTSVTAFR